VWSDHALQCVLTMLLYLVWRLHPDIMRQFPCVVDHHSKYALPGVHKLVTGLRCCMAIAASVKYNCHAPPTSPVASTSTSSPARNTFPALQWFSTEGYTLQGLHNFLYHWDSAAVPQVILIYTSLGLPCRNERVKFETEIIRDLLESQISRADRKLHHIGRDLCSGCASVSAC